MNGSYALQDPAIERFSDAIMLGDNVGGEAVLS